MHGTRLLLTGALGGILLAASPRSLHDRYLSPLAGVWNVDGTVAGRKTHEIAEGTWVLDNEFLLLHFKGQYEADVYIGWDSQRHRYVEHWLDIFGGSGATAVGFGTVSGDTLTIRFNYSDGPFLNAMRYDPSRREWLIRYASERHDGRWESFGEERLTQRGSSAYQKPPANAEP